MAKVKNENTDTEQKKVKKTTTSKKTGRTKATTNAKANKASTATVSKTGTRKRANSESAVPDLKEKLSEIIPRAYNFEKFKDWTEQAEETTCKSLHIVVKSSAGKHCHNFQIKLYLRELAEKNGWALTDLQLFDDHFEFTIVQPIHPKTIEVN